MRSLCLFLALSTSLALAASPSYPATETHSAPALVIKDIGPGEVPIGGDWEFHLGDDMRWADPAYDDSHWERIKADNPWGAQTHPSYTGFAWYRRQIDITPSSGGPQKLAILIPPVDDAYELYWNGLKIGHQGTPPPEAVWYYPHRQSFALPTATSGATRGLLAIRVWKAPLISTESDDSGGLHAQPVVGDAAVIAEDVGRGDFRRLRSSLYGRAISFFFLMMATVSLFAWVRDRQRSLYLWFAMWLLAKVGYFYLLSDQMIESVSSYMVQLGGLLFYSIAYCSMFLLLLYLLDLQGDRRLRRWAWIAIGINLGFGLADGIVLVGWANAGLIMQWTDAVLTTVWTLSELYVFVLVYQGLKRKLDLSRQLVAIMAFLVYLHDIVQVTSAQGSRFTHWTLYERMLTPLFNIAGAGITVRDILESFLLISLVYALMRYALEQRRHTETIEMELKSAQEVQQVLIPEALPDVAGYAIQSVYQPAREVGGDFFQIIPLEDDSTLVILGDVSGKGLKAAMAVALIVGALRTLAEVDSDPASILAGLNRRLSGRLQGGFVTAVVMKLNRWGDCTLANAGHLPPFLNSNEVTLMPSLPLGLVPDSDYVDEFCTLNDNDRLTLYTDGVLEATNSEGELYGFERITALFANRPDADTIAKTASAFGQDDDITVLTVTRLSVCDEVETASISLSTS